MTLRFLIVLSLICSCAEVRAEVSVGVGVPLSGDGAWLGRNVLDGINLYLKQEELATANLLKIEDVPLSNTPSGISAVRKLVDMERVRTLILCASPVVSAVGPMLDQKQIPTVAIVGADTAEGRSFQVRLWPRSDDEMKAIADEFRSKRMAVLYSEQESMLARKDSLESSLSHDEQMVFSSSVTDQTANSILPRLLAATPEVVVLLAMPGVNGSIAKRLRQLRYGGVFAGSPAINAEEEVKVSGGTLAGAFYPDAAMTGDFVERYRNEYGRFPGTGAASGYDAIKMLIEAGKGAGGDPAVINKKLRDRKFSGAMGHYGLMHDGSNSFRVPVVLRRVVETAS